MSLASDRAPTAQRARVQAVAVAALHLHGNLSLADARTRLARAPPLAHHSSNASRPNPPLSWLAPPPNEAVLQAALAPHAPPGAQQPPH